VDDQVIRLTFRTDTAQVNTAKESVKGLHDATEKLTASKRDLGRSALEAGRALQDFSQGGVGGILNNIEGLSLALGGGAGLAGVMTAVGLAAYFAMPHIKSFFEEARNNPIPENIDSLKGMEDRLKDVTKRLGELRENQKLTNTELAEYNRLTAEEAELTAKANAEKARKAELDKLDKSVTDEQAARGAAFTDAMEGRAGGVQEGLVKALQSEQAARVNEYAAIAAKKLKEALEDPTVSQAQYDAMAAKFGDEIEAMKKAQPEDDARIAGDLRRRAAKGDQSAIARIKELAGRGGSADLQGAVTAYQDPAETAAYDAEAEKFDADMKARAEARKARDARLKKEAEAKSATEMAWWDDQAATVAADEDQKQEDRRKAEKAAAEAKRRAAEAEKQEREWSKAPNTDDLARNALAEDLMRSGAMGGATLGTAKEVASRSLELQSAGIDAMTATQQAMMEMMAAMNGAIAQYQALRANAEQMRRDAETRRTWLMRGGGGR
jgi:hypothetical protein